MCYAPLNLRFRSISRLLRTSHNKFRSIFVSLPYVSDYKNRPKQSIYAQPRSISYRLPIDPTQVLASSCTVSITVLQLYRLPIDPAQVLASSCTVSITTAVRYLYQYTGIRYQYIRYQYTSILVRICMRARSADLHAGARSCSTGTVLVCQRL